MESDDERYDEHLLDEAHPAVKAEAAPAPVRRYRAELFQMTLFVWILLFAALTYLAEQSPFFQIDLQVTQAFQALSASSGGQWLTVVMSAVSWPGYLPQSMILTVVIIVVLFGVGLRLEALSASGVAIAAFGMDLFVKTVIGRPRPSPSLVQVMRILDSYSFPSGHVAFYTGFFGFLWYLSYTLLKRSWKRTLLLVIFGGLVLLVGASRIYLGVHWASDVAGGYMLGSLLLAACILVYRWGKRVKSRI